MSLDTSWERTSRSEAEEVLRAISSGEVEAFVLTTPHGKRVFRLETTDEQYRLLFHTLSEGIARTDDAHVVLFANDRFAQIFGRATPELFMIQLETLVHAGDHDATARTLEEGGVCEVRTTTEDGTVRIIRLSVQPTSPGANVVATDITQQKRTERALWESQRALADMNATLEARIAARTSELESFTYAVSHDLQAPLRAIEGFSLILAEQYGDRLEEGAHRLVERVVAAAQRMGGMIDGLLILSRVQRAEIEPESIDLTGMCASIVSELREAEPDRAVDIRIGAPMRAVGARALVEIVMRNLLQNAWKFTSQTTAPRIEVGAGERPGTFSVSDNGVGFEDADAEKVFTPFARLHDRAVFPGSGIGLATVRRIVERHGGTITAHGTPGEGARFVFSFAPLEKG